MNSCTNVTNSHVNMRYNMAKVSICKKRAYENECKKTDGFLARNRISTLSTTYVAKSLVPFYEWPVVIPCHSSANTNDPLQLRASACLSRSIDRVAVVARIIPGLIWDFETITAVNPRYHLSRELSLLSFFPVFNDTVCSV